MAETRIIDTGDGRGWRVLGEWFGTWVPVFECDPLSDPWTQLWDCADYVRSLDTVHQ